ncbi:hypothetical protein SYNTR_0404 [Candidatus Syntrophocurvum alkaliphilum]|uniref:Dodecin n=1 Tax=Candidatus Syntrophocurvum alkaliphilum TaxID=2293317 RepID=A0A6I6D922_9FIRM|nr:dodecin family protein [Candidatus Syntrophocurvum alkaliphilum]QGT98997.1 hypothetical protein SYNTR_0404 [Candidatus Syntrophocurvum alkaliphilum]
MQIRIEEFVGESNKSWDDAVKQAVKEASNTISNISGVEVYNWTADCQDNNIIEYKANVKIAYTK